jgi:hypothetical protein
MAKLLTEYYQLTLSPQQLNEAASSKTGDRMILNDVVIQRADNKNRNGRIYPEKILRREMDKFNDTMVKNNRALGELDHADSNVVNLKNVSHNIIKIYWDGDDVRGNIEILDSPEFPAGRIAAGLLRRGIPVGISSRGMGSVDEAHDGTVVVNDDFSLLTFDLVSFESTQGANMSLKEGFDATNTINKFKSIDGILRDLICNNSGVCSC